MGVRVWGPVTQATLTLGRSDIWDRRWFGGRQRLITLKEISKLAFEDSLSEIAKHPNETAYWVYSHYPFPCPKLGGHLIIGTPFAQRGSVKRNPDGSLELRLEGKGKALRVRVWISPSRMIVVLECQCRGLDPEDIWIRIHRHRDTVKAGPPLPAPLMGRYELVDDFSRIDEPTCCQADPGFGIVQDLPSDPTFPEGFSVAVMGVIDSGRWSIDNVRGEPGLGTPYWAPEEGRIDHGLVKVYSPVNESPGSATTAECIEIPTSFNIYATVSSTQDSRDPVNLASSTLKDALKVGVGELAYEREEDLKAGSRGAVRSQASVGESRIEAPDLVKPRLRVPDGYYGDIPLCSVSSTKFCFQDASPWHGDFHLNEIRAEGMLTLGQFDELIPYCEMIHTLLPQAMENAGEIYDLPGAMYPLVHFPLRCRGIAHTNLTWEQDIGINGLVTKPLWLYYRHTGDLGFLENTAYPVMKSCAEFCHSYLTEGEDDRLHIFPTVSPEHWGLTPNFERNRDCTSALTLTSYLLRKTAEAADILGQDRKSARLWLEEAERLVDYPQYRTPGGPVWVDVADAPPIEYNIPVPLAPVFWGDEIGLDSPKERLQLALRTLDQIRVWPPHRGYLDSCIRPRLGICRPGAEIFPENLLLSYQSIRIFPAAPRDAPIRMKMFAAEGGFRVSAQRKPGERIEGVSILSNLGQTCGLANPWPGSEVLVKGPSGEVGMFRGRLIDFDTEPSCWYSLEPVGNLEGEAAVSSG